MKTLNDAPQFDLGQDPLCFNDINKLLREWAESRRCVKCENYYNSGANTIEYCSKLGCMINEPETFSCAAFSPIETAGGKNE